MMKVPGFIQSLSGNRRRDGRSSHSPREEARRGAQRAVEIAGQDGDYGQGPPTRSHGQRAQRGPARTRSDAGHVGRKPVPARDEFYSRQLKTTRTDRLDKQQTSMDPLISHKQLNLKPQESWLQGEDEVVSHEDDLLGSMASSRRGSDPPLLPPQVRDISRIAGPWQNPGSQSIDIRRLGEDGSDLNLTMGNISKQLRRMKMEFPSIQFEKDIPHFCSPTDIETALRDVISAYGSLYQRSYDFEKALGVAAAECDSLRTKLDEWALRGKEFEDKVLSLKQDNEKEKHKLEFLRDEHATREQKHEDKLEKLKQNYREEVAVHETAMKEDIATMKRDYDMWRVASVNQMNSEFLAEKAALSSTIKSQQESYGAQLTKLEKQNEDDRQRMTSKHQSIQAEMERRLGEEMLTMERMMKSTTEQFQMKVENMQNEHDQEMGRKAAEMTEIKEEHVTEKEKMQKLHNAEKMALESKRVQENQSLRENVESLKGALVRRDHFKALSDRELALRFQDLASEVVEFARVRWDNTRKPTWPFPEKALHNSENERRTKQYIVQNTIWVIFYERIFCTPFRVLGDEGKSLEREWIVLYDENRKSTGAFAPSPRPTKESEKWRYETVKKCLEAISKPLLEWEPNYNLKRGYEISMGEIMEDVSQELERIASLDGSDKQRMSDLVRKAAQLWLEIGQQRYRIFLLMSASGEKPSRSGQAYLDNDGAQDLVAMPELRRMGNAQGERLEKDELVSDCKGKFSVFYG